MSLSNFTRFAMCVLAIGTVCQSASAATWFYMTPVAEKTTVYFFDSDTVMSSRGKVNVWIKAINDVRATKSPVYATVAKFGFVCSERTIQEFQSTDYDQDGAPRNPTSWGWPPREVTPDSVGERLLKLVCSPNFPNAPEGAMYWQVAGNDTKQVAEEFFDGVKKLKFQGQVPAH